MMYEAPCQVSAHVIAKPHNTDKLRPRDDLAKGHRAEGPPGSQSLVNSFSWSPYPQMYPCLSHPSTQGILPPLAPPHASLSLFPDHQKA